MYPDMLTSTIFCCSSKKFVIHNNSFLHNLQRHCNVDEVHPGGDQYHLD